MPEFLSYGFMQRAFAAGAVMGTVAPLVGVFLVLRRLSLLADALSHTALVGVACALLLGAYPLWGALVAAVLAAGGIEWVRSRWQVSGEAALAVFLMGGLGIAVVLLSVGRGFGPDLFAYLFGTLTAVSPQDLLTVSILGAIGVGTTVLFYKELFAIALDEEAARTQGIPVDAVNLVFTLLVAGTVVVAMRVVGVLLTSALLVLPPLGAMQVGRSFRGTLGAAVVLGLLSVVAGLVGSFYLNVPPSGAVVLTGLLLFAGTALFGRRTG